MSASKSSPLSTISTVRARPTKRGSHSSAPPPGRPCEGIAAKERGAEPGECLSFAWYPPRWRRAQRRRAIKKRPGETRSPPDVRPARHRLKPGDSLMSPGPADRSGGVRLLLLGLHIGELGMLGAVGLALHRAL